MIGPRDTVDPERDGESATDTAEAALLAFKRAHARGEAPDLDVFCSTYAARTEEAQMELLRARIGDFLFVHEGLRSMGSKGRKPGLESRTEDGLPRQIGPYCVRELLGEGGMGTVYRVEQKEPVKREAALKLIKLGMDTRRVLQRFDAERQTLAMMEHSAIARVFDAGTSEHGQPFFVMEYVRGQSITDYCRERGLGLEERIRLFQRVCAGVQHAHQRGVVHRDLKPSNILVVEEDGRPCPKIIDFGLAKAIEQTSPEHSVLTRAGQVIGTPGYMSPEQASLEVQDVDQRADVYALGVTLYELLTGELPIGSEDFRASGPREMRMRICEEQPEAPSIRVRRRQANWTAAQSGATDSTPRVPNLHYQLRGDLDWICLKALEKDRDRRYSSAQQFAADLERFLNLRPIEARAPSRVYRMRRFVRKHRVLVASTSVVIASLATGLLFALVFYFESRADKMRAEASLAEKEEMVSTLLRAIVRMKDDQNQQGDRGSDTWSEGFESYAESGALDEKTGKLRVGEWDSDMQGVREKPGWFNAGDTDNIFLDEGIRNCEGRYCLRIQGIEGRGESACIARRIDSWHHGYLPGFTLSLRIRCDRSPLSGLNCALQPRPSWRERLSPDQFLPAHGRYLFKLHVVGEHGGSPTIKLVIGEDPDQSHWVPFTPLTFHELKICYQQLVGNRIQITGWLNGKPLSPPPPRDAYEYEQDLRWLYFGSAIHPAWIDDLRVRRVLPHSPWHQYPPTSKYYMLTPEPMTLSAARIFANERGGRVASIGDEDLKTWILRTFGRNEILVGVHRDRGKGSGWHWIDGLRVDPAAWQGGVEPSDPVLQHAFLGGYEVAYPYSKSGRGDLIPALPDTTMPVLLQFERQPTRATIGILAGDLDSAMSLGGYSFADPFSVASVAADDSEDNTGGFVVLGTFRDRAVLGVSASHQDRNPGERKVVINAVGGKEAFLVKFNAAGEILWARVFGGTGEDSSGGVDVHTDGSILITGSFSGTAILRGPTGNRMKAHTLTSSGERDVFVACFEADGECRWMQRVGGPNEDYASGVACSSDGGVFVCGSVSKGARIGRDGRELISRGQSDIFLACYAIDGTLRWWRTAGGRKNDTANAVTALTDGSVVITGVFRDQAHFGERENRVSFSSLTDNNEHEGNLFVARYRADDGSLSWARHPGGHGGRTGGHAVAAGEDGSVFVAGTIDGQVFFGTPRQTYSENRPQWVALDGQLRSNPGDVDVAERLRGFHSMSSLGWVDVFLVKYDSDGTVCWSKRAAGQDGNNIAYGVSVADDGSVLLTGQIRGACVFGEHEPYQCLRSSHSMRRPDMFLASFRPDGSLAWARSARGPGTNWGSAVAVVGKKWAVVVGGLAGPMNFGEGEPNGRTLDRGAVFVSRFRLDGIDPKRARGAK